MKKILKWLVRGLAGLVLVCILLAILLFQKVDRTPYKETEYYKRMSAQLDTFSLDSIKDKGDFIKVGWSKESITPSYMPHLAGYGIRAKADCIHDSVFTKVFVFDNGKNKVAFITVELLVFPPSVKNRLYKEVERAGYPPENLYLTATHTHSAPGGWAAGFAGRLLAGEYNEAYVNFIVDKIIKAIKKAEVNMELAKFSTSKINASAFVKNRINKPDSETDPWVRILKIEKESGAKACLVLYSAHATCLKIENTCISGDYPSRLTGQLEKSGKVDFAIYAAGMVGSHIPTNQYDLEDLTYANQYADSLTALIVKNIDSTKALIGTTISMKCLDLHLREPHLKIAKDWRIKPWVFDYVFGDYYPKLKILKINDLLFIGTPCDFSGELMKDFEALSDEKNIQLYITSFNGGYIGYVNVDKYYDEDKAETRDMNWFGPYNQAYFTEIIQRILTKI